MNIILVGFMGSGKTTLGKKIANRLGLQFVDSDLAIEQQENVSISELFQTHGEAHFRALESSFLQTINKDSNIVLSTGGGMPCFNNAMERLNELGTTIYLDHPPKELAHRLLHAKQQRPLVMGKSEAELLEYITTTLEFRATYYNQADIILHRNQQKASVVESLIHSIQQK